MRGLPREDSIPPVGGRLSLADEPPWRSLLRIALFVAPVAYAGLILSAFVHEAAGHGGAAWLTGVSFEEFFVFPSGGGASLLGDRDHALAHVSVGLSGFVAEAALGGLLLLSYLRMRPSGTLRLAIGCMVLGTLGGVFAQMADGLFPALAHTDVSLVVRSLDAPWLAISLGVAGLLGTVAIVLGPGRLLLREGETMLGDPSRGRTPLRATLVVTLVVLSGASGVGLLPIIEVPNSGWTIASIVAVHGALSAVLFTSPGTARAEGCRTPAPNYIAIAAAWGVAAAAYGLALWSLSAAGFLEIYRLR